MFKLRYTLIITFLMVINITAQTHFFARLTGHQEVPSVNTDAVGVAAFSLTEQGLEYIITISDLTITGASINYGESGDTGMVVRDIMFDGQSTHGTWTRTGNQPFVDSLIEALAIGKLYVNVRTSANPTGELRGQIIAASGTPFRAHLYGSQEVPPVESQAKGTGTFLLTDVGLIYKITVNDPDITAAHFHMGKLGEAGGVVKPIEFENNTAVGIWMREGGTQPLTDSLLMHLMLSHLYVNVHTAANPAGEIRGQVLLTGGMGFTAVMEGTQAIPANQSTGRGLGHIMITPHGVVYSFQTSGLTPTAAHLQLGDANSTGSVLKTMTLMDSSSGEGVWLTSDLTQGLNRENLLDLLRGRVYMNIYSAQYPAGEIRGAVRIDSGSSFHAELTGLQEKPEVMTNAKGMAALYLTNQGLRYHIAVMGDTFTAAHFHLAEIGKPGPVVKTIQFNMDHASGLWAFSDTSQALNDTLLNHLLLGNIYINFHTADNPQGEIRGQVFLEGGVNFSTQLTGNQERPNPVTTDASGTGYFIWTEVGIIHNITLTDINLTGSHIHSGRMGVAGGIVKGLEFENLHNMSVWKRTDPGESFTDSLLRVLFKGDLYVNAHSANNPGGEIRGQIHLSGGWGFVGALSGRQHRPMNMTPSTGTSFGMLTNAGFAHYLVVSGMRGMMGANFHNAGRGMSGGVVRNIRRDFEGNFAFTFWTVNDSQPFNENLRNELIAENIYINMTSQNYPQGEIRGQLTPSIGNAVVSVEQESSVTPETFDLMQNYPNPFNPITNIKFSLPKEELVNISVFNSIGEELSILLNEVKAPGVYNLSFNASDLPSGIYFYRIKAGDFTKTMKMVLLK